jgi:hypothetical protein
MYTIMHVHGRFHRGGLYSTQSRLAVLIMFSKKCYYGTHAAGQPWPEGSAELATPEVAWCHSCPDIFSALLFGGQSVSGLLRLLV